MATIKDLQGFDLDGLETKFEPLKKHVQRFLDDYEKEEDKKEFEKIAQGNIDKLFTLLKKALPDRAKSDRPAKKQKTSASKDKSKPKSKPTQDASAETTEKILEELKAMEPELAACRRKIRDYNSRRRETQPPKPKPTRHTQLKDKLLSIVKLMPDKHKEDEKVLAETEEILLDTHSRLVSAWGMDKVRSKPGATAIMEKFDDLQEKKAKEERSKIAKRWQDKLPDTEKVMKQEWNSSEQLEAEAKEIVSNLREAIRLYKQDVAKAVKFLEAKFSKAQLDKYLPDFVREDLGLGKAKK